LFAELVIEETGDWKVAGTRRLESLRYVAQTFLSAGAGDFPVPGYGQRHDAHIPRSN